MKTKSLGVNVRETALQSEGIYKSRDVQEAFNKGGIPYQPYSG